MRNRLRPSLIWLTALVLAACGDRDAGSDGAPGQAAETVTETPAAAPSDSAPAPGTATVEPAEEQDAEAAPSTDETPPASEEAQAVSLEARVEQLIAGQQEIQRRLDSLSGAGAGTGRRPDTGSDSGSAGSATGQEVLGQAGQSVRSFGVAVAWSILVLVVFNFFIRGTVWLLDTLAERSASRRLFYKRLAPIVRIVLWVFVAYLIVSVIFQIDAQGILAAAAAIGVAVGFAAQDLLKNLFGGLILVFDQPFQVGDKISVGGTYGEVVSIGLRSTRIVTADDNLVSVPNAQVVDQQVANANAGQLHCQVVTDLFLPGWADEETAKRIAFDAAASSKYVYLNKPIVVLVADVFQETFLTRVRVKAYVLDPRLEFQFQSDVTERARTGFREAGLIGPQHMAAHLALHPPAADVPHADD